MRLAIFDMDGTVIDTISDIHTCLNKTLITYGFPPISIETAKNSVGKGMRELIIKSVGSENFTEMMEKYFRAVYRDNMMNTTSLIDGTERLFEYLSGADIKTAILSNKLHSITNEMAERFDLGRYFDGWYGGDSFGAKKPSPAGVLGIMNEFDVRPEDTIMIGDSYSDIAAGAAAKAATCFCSYGYGNLKGTEADYIVDSPAEIIKVLEAVK